MQLSLTDDLSIYSAFNDPLLEFYNNIYSKSDEWTDYISKDYCFIVNRYNKYFSYIVSQEIRDIYHAISYSKVIDNIFCFDTSLSREDLSIWDNNSEYGDLNQHTWNLLEKYTTPNRKHIERVYIIFDVEGLVENKSKFKQIYRIAKEQVLHSIGVYFIHRNQLKESINGLLITDEMLDFHIVNNKLLDVMDIETLISYRFDSRCQEGVDIISSFEELFLDARDNAKNNNNGFELNIAMNAEDVKCELESLIIANDDKA